MSELVDRFRALPRAGRWLVAGAGVVALWFVLVRPILDRTDVLGENADRTASALARERKLAEDWSSEGRPLAAARREFGTPALPGPDAQRKQALYTRVNQILDKHRVRPEITEHVAQLRDDNATKLVEGGERIDRLILDLTFEADPATVTAVLADLEQAEEVAAVSKVSLRRVEPGRSGSGPTHRVRAVISPEAWVRVSALSGSGGRQ